VAQCTHTASRPLSSAPPSQAAWLRQAGYECFWQSGGHALSPFVRGCDYDTRRKGSVVCSHDAALRKLLHTLVPRALASAR
jgi:hypothetical protein